MIMHEGKIHCTRVEVVHIRCGCAMFSQKSDELLKQSMSPVAFKSYILCCVAPSEVYAVLKGWKIDDVQNCYNMCIMMSPHFNEIHRSCHLLLHTL